MNYLLLSMMVMSAMVALSEEQSLNELLREFTQMLDEKNMKSKCI